MKESTLYGKPEVEQKRKGWWFKSIPTHFKEVVMKILNFYELEKIMTEKQKREANEAFHRVYPVGTPEIMCTSETPEGVDYNVLVDLELFS